MTEQPHVKPAPNAARTTFMPRRRRPLCSASNSSEGNVAAINPPFGASFLSQSQGWVVGENLQTDAFDIEVTANSGRTWTTQYTTRQPQDR